jgi:MFS family permease
MLRRATALCFGVPLVLYAITAARTVQGGDTGEFACIGVLGGVAHPPGYPLYTLLARLAAHLPFGPLFWRVSMASALSGALASAALFLLLYRVTSSLEASLVATFAFALSPLEWRLSGVPEVFALHAFFCCLAMILSLSLSEATGATLARRSGLLGLTLGLSMTNHQTTILLAPLVLWAYVTAWRGNAWRGVGASLAFSLGGALLGLGAYLLLPLYAHSAPGDTLAWGRTDTWDGFFVHILRQEYGTTRLHAGAGAEQFDPMRHVLSFLTGLPREFAFFFVPVGLGGLYFLPKRRSGFGVALLLSLLLAGVIFISVFNLPNTTINNEVTERFHLMPNLLFTVFIAAGLAEFQTRVRPQLFWILSAATLLLGGVTAGLKANWSRDDSIERFLKAQVESTQPGAVILGWADTNGPGILWVTRVLGDHPDAHYIDVNLMMNRWYVERKQRELPALSLTYSPTRRTSAELATLIAPHAPTYVIPWVYEEAAKTVTLEPNGFLHRVVPTGTAPLPLAEAERRMELAAQTFGQPRPPIDAWAEMVHIAAGAQWLRIAEDYRKAGRQDKFEELGQRAMQIMPPDWADDANAP